MTFVPGTTTNKTWEEVHALLIGTLKVNCNIDAEKVVPVYAEVKDGDEPVIEGFTIHHAEPKPRATRSDKGIPKGSRKDPAGPETDPKGNSVTPRESGRKSPLTSSEGQL